MGRVRFERELTISVAPPGFLSFLWKSLHCVTLLGGVWGTLTCEARASQSDAGDAIVIATDRKIQVDGILEEWGAPQSIPIRPGGQLVGLRGAFEGKNDHEVDLYLMWSAENLYLAAIVSDDTTDIGRVGPQEYVWKGPKGELKDRMFYFDHLKLFLRAPKAYLGYNVWISPSGPDAHLWGSQQRSPGHTDVPVEAGSAVVEGLYTYEVAIPWSWLQVYPRPGMLFDAMFLLPDSDLPNLPLEEKIARSNKWIWWKGTIQLEGVPPGWKPPVAPVEEQVREGADELKARVEEGKSRSELAAKEKVEIERQAALAAETRRQRIAEQAASRQAKSQKPTDQQKAVASTLPDLAELERVLNAPAAKPTAPVWIADVHKEITPSQAQSLFGSLVSNLRRYNQARSSSRIDILIADMARDAGTRKVEAKAFIMGLLERALAQIGVEESPLRTGLADAAADAGVQPEQAAVLVANMCQSALRWYDDYDLFDLTERDVLTTHTLLKEGSRKARVSQEQAGRIIASGLQNWR